MDSSQVFGAVESDAVSLTTLCDCKPLTHVAMVMFWLFTTSVFPFSFSSSEFMLQICVCWKSKATPSPLTPVLFSSVSLNDTCIMEAVSLRLKGSLLSTTKIPLFSRWLVSCRLLTVELFPSQWLSALTSPSRGFINASVSLSGETSIGMTLDKLLSSTWTGKKLLNVSLYTLSWNKGLFSPWNCSSDTLPTSLACGSG